MTNPVWHIAGVSVQGTSHLERGLPCQDAHASLLTAQGALLLAIADGAGSAARSQEGAQLAVKQAITSLESALHLEVPQTEPGWQSLMTRVFAEALEAVSQLAESENTSLNSFATTLACAVIYDDWLAVGQLGDGAVVAEELDGSLLLTVRPQRGEYANEAYFITMPDGLNHLETYAAHRLIQSLVLTTDGLLRLAFKLPECEPSPQFFQPLLAFIAEMDSPEQGQAELTVFLNSARVIARTDDDKTLVLAMRTKSADDEGQGP